MMGELAVLGLETGRTIRCGMVLAWLLFAVACREDEQTPQLVEGVSDWSSHVPFLSEVLTPFWEASRLVEPLFFIQPDPSERPTAQLLFVPQRVVRVQSSDRTREFAEGRDYMLDPETGRLSLPPGSHIPFKTEAAMYPVLGSGGPMIAAHADDPSRGIFFSEGAVYHGLQVEVVYEPRPGQWQGWTPRSAVAALPRTFAKLGSGAGLELLLTGDSITHGSNATKIVNAPPHLPPYGELVAAGLASQYGGSVVLYNNGHGGWRAWRGRLQAEQWRTGRQKPDLVIIAFGMNDLSYRDADQYRDDVQGIMDAIRLDSPETEFILIATMIGNRIWSRLPSEQFFLYRDALRSLSGPGVAFADMTAIWEVMLQRKGYYDTTGNGVNHPNDFGHRIYAQVILEMLR
jgi:lysophospholipase L1-like esterase